jgi:hypothetical protein
MIVAPVSFLASVCVNLLTSVIQCARCTQSVGTTQRATNGHRFVFHAAEIVASERHYVLNEHGVRRTLPPAQPSSFGGLDPASSSPSTISLQSQGSMDAAHMHATARAIHTATTGSGPEVVAPSPPRPTFAPRTVVSPTFHPHYVEPQLDARDQDDRYASVDDGLSNEGDEALNVGHTHSRGHSSLHADTTSDTLDLSSSLDDVTEDRPSPLSPSAQRALELGHPLLAGPTVLQTAHELAAARAQLDVHRHQLAHLRALRTQWEATASTTAAAAASAAAAAAAAAETQQEKDATLRAGDIVHWHNLSKAGEIAGVRDDLQARTPRAARQAYDR